MGYDTGIASRLRAAGLRVSEVSGWQSRGSSSFTPRGSVNHHTAGSASGSAPSLNTCIYGRPDLAGPLCNVMQSREPDGNDIAYVIAAGRANHAGEGGWRGMSGNSTVYGLEIEHTGTSTLSEGRQRIAARIHAAMYQGADVGMVCQHYEWASGRKIDAATNVNGNTFRQYVADARAGRGPTPAPEPPDDEEDDLIIFTSSGKPQYALSGGKAAGIKSATDSTAIQKLAAYKGMVTLSSGTYDEWIRKFRDGATGA